MRFLETLDNQDSELPKSDPFVRTNQADLLIAIEAEILVDCLVATRAFAIRATGVTSCGRRFRPAKRASAMSHPSEPYVDDVPQPSKQRRAKVFPVGRDAAIVAGEIRRLMVPDGGTHLLFALPYLSRTSDAWPLSCLPTTWRSRS